MENVADIYFFIVCKINSVQIAGCLIHAHICRKRSSRLRPLRHHKFHNGYGRSCNIGLCDSRDYFASPLLLVQNKFNLTMTFLSKKPVN